MLQLQPVSKYRKEIYSRSIKEKSKQNAGTSPDYFSHALLLSELEEELSIVKEEKYEDRQFEDSHLTKFIHEQLTLIKLSLNLLAVISIMLSLMQSFLTFTNGELRALLSLHSIISLIMVILIFCKYLKYEELKNKQLIRRKSENKYLRLFKSTWLEVILLILHPNLLTRDVVFLVNEPIFKETVPLELNTLLQIGMLTRIYLLYNALVSTSIYCSTRADRLCRIYNTKDSQSFGLKSVFNTYPLHSLLILYLTLVMVYSQMLSLAEKYNSNFNNFEDFVWCIVITMGTIGYGDYYPATYAGRMIAFAAAISGIIMASLLILTLSQYLAMGSKQSKSHITLKRLELRKQLERYAEETLAETSLMGKEGGAGAIEALKTKAQRVKLTMRRLKNMVDTDNLNEEINNLFQSLYASLMEIFMQQEAYAKELMRLKQKDGAEIQRINFTFAGQIENIIKDR